MNNQLQKITDILSSIDNTMEDDAKVAAVRGYWQVGKILTEYKSSTGKLLKDIADELFMSDKELQKYAQFYRSFPDGYPERYHGRVIHWTYIRTVLPVHDPKARDFYLNEACRNNWSKRDLVLRINDKYYQTVTESTSFNAKKVKVKQAVKPTEQQLYTYVAQVIKTVDGDTMDLEIDVGFKLRQEHRVRLRGINCPEMETKEGQKAKRFVESELAACVVQKPGSKGEYAPRPVVVIKTYKQGMYGRYIADIIYLKGESNPENIVKYGKLLNQVLLDEGLAARA